MAEEVQTTENPLNRKKIAFSMDSGEPPSSGGESSSSTMNGLHGEDMEEITTEKPRYTYISYYFMLVWAGIPFPGISKTLQTIYDFIVFYVIVLIGLLYIAFLIESNGFLNSIMWIFIEVGAMGCWCSYFYAVRWTNAVYKPQTTSVEAWRTDLGFVIIGLGLYAILAGVYFSELDEILSGLNHAEQVIEIIHASTSWARFGAIAATAQSFFIETSTNYISLRNLRQFMEQEIDDAFLFRKTNYLETFHSRSRSNTTNPLTDTTKSSYNSGDFQNPVNFYSSPMVNSLGGNTVNSSSYEPRKDLIHRWLYLNHRTQATNYSYSTFIAVLIGSQSLAFLTWSLNNLISTDNTVNRSIAGVTILGYSVITILIVAKASQLTSEMEKSAAAASEYWACTSKDALRLLYPGLADSIKFLGAITTLTIAVLRLKATWN